jgi:hypothetical protein
VPVAVTVELNVPVVAATLAGVVAPKVPLKAPATVEENVAAPVTPRVELKLPVVADKAAGVVPPMSRAVDSA